MRDHTLSDKIDNLDADTVKQQLQVLVTDSLRFLNFYSEL